LIGATFTHATQVPVIAGQMNPAAFATPQAAIIEHGNVPAGYWVELQGNVLRIGTTDPMQAQPVLDALRSAGMLIRRFQQVRPSLEDLFIEAIGKQQEASRPGARIGK
jgi:hypothetical protein